MPPNPAPRIPAPWWGSVTNQHPFLWLLQVLDHLNDHLQRSQYFRFLWFPHSENVSVIYQDPTNKAGPTGLHVGREKGPCTKLSVLPEPGFRMDLQCKGCWGG